MSSAVNGSTIVLSGTTAQRDAAPVNGYIRYNTTLGLFEGYLSGVWTAFSSAGGAIDGSPIGATTRSTGAFTTLTANGATSLTAGTASTSTGSGTLVVTGGVGISGAVYAGSIQATPIGSTTAASGAFTTLAASGATTLASTLAVTGITTLNAAVVSAQVTLADAATITPDFSLANNFAVTLAGNRVLANPSNLNIGQSGIFVITQDATGNRTLAFGSQYKFESGVAPTLSTAANSLDAVAYYVTSATHILARWVGNLS
jgi:hypothetical protein